LGQRQMAMIEAAERVLILKRASASRRSGEAGGRQRTADHFVATCATGKRLICKLPLSTRPIMARAPTSRKIVINWLVRSLIA
jgi:hypothetical protein